MPNAQWHMLASSSQVRWELTYVRILALHASRPTIGGGDGETAVYFVTPARKDVTSAGARAATAEKTLVRAYVHACMLALASRCICMPSNDVA